MTDPINSEGLAGPAPSQLPALATAELEARITELAGYLNAASHRWLLLIAEFDRREGWADGITHSCAHWLGWKCGIDLGAAREKVRVARALGDLPQISAAMARGALSYSKVRALTRVATSATEDTLLMIALHGTAHHVETVVRHYRRAQEAMAVDREAQQFASRHLRYHFDDDGSLVLQARLPAEVGALVVKALERASDLRDEAHVSAETSTTLGQRGADALGRFAETWLAQGDRALSGGGRQQIVVHVDAGMLRSTDRAVASPAIDAHEHSDDPASVWPAGRCELDEGPPLSVQTARRLACDASLVRIVEDSFGRTLDVGRKTRTIPPAIRRALQSRDRACRVPGCTHTRYLDGHHIQHWADGGATRLSNLVLLCRFHHRQVHEGRIGVQVLDDGALRFLDEKGRALEVATPMHGDHEQLIVAHTEAGIAIDAHTAVTRWAGERMDLGMVIEGLAIAWEKERARTERARTSSHQANVSAGTSAS